MPKGTLGQLIINDMLPDDLKDYNRVLDKEGIETLLREVAHKHPDKYRDISFRMLQVGKDGAQESGGLSFGLQHLETTKAALAVRQRVRASMQQILSNPNLTPAQKNEQIVLSTGKEMKPQQQAIFEEALKAKNPLAVQVLSGSRGNQMNLASLLGSDLLYADNRDKPIPFPVLHSYSEGLSPSEYWAGAYGARKGVTATKLATADAGFFAKQLNAISHRLVVEDDDYDDEEQRNVLRGLPVDTDDFDNEGSLLARDFGPYTRNTQLTPKILKHLKQLGINRLLVRSPITGGSPSGGVYAKDVGVRERGTLPGRGEFVGMQAAQALAEPLSQGQLSAKHSGGVAGEEKAVSGFAYVNQLLQVPKTFKGGAAHATLDGTVQRVEDAPAGGSYVTIDGKQHYVGTGYAVKVKRGDNIEAGDVLSEGFPNPAMITQYKGLGEGKKYFVHAMRDAMRGAGIKANRRNIELLARASINHVKLTEEYNDMVPDDVIPYSTLEHQYVPREGFQKLAPKQAVGKYLERPVLHHTIGTKIRPSMLKDLEEFGANELLVHDNPAPFEPQMIRGMDSLQHDPDWMTRFYGSKVKSSLLDSVHRGGMSDEAGSSFVPSLARSVDFGKIPGSITRKADAGTPAIPDMPTLPKPVFTADREQAEFMKAAETSNVTKPLESITSTKPSTSLSGPTAKVKQPLTPGLFNSPLGGMVPGMIQQANKTVPGAGGVAALGMSVSPQSLGTLTEGMWNKGNNASKPGLGNFSSQAAEPAVHQPTGTGQPLGGQAPRTWDKFTDDTMNSIGKTLSGVSAATNAVWGNTPDAVKSTAIAGGAASAISKLRTGNWNPLAAVPKIPTPIPPIPSAAPAASTLGKVVGGATKAVGSKFLMPGIDAANVAYQVGSGNGQEWADHTAEKNRSLISGQDGWWTPLTALQAYSSPASNLHLAAETSRQGIQAGNAVADNLDSKYTVGESAMQAHMQHGNSINPLSDTGNDKYTSFDEIGTKLQENPYNIADVGVELTGQLAGIKGNAAAVKSHGYDQDNQRMFLLEQRVADIQKNQASSVPISAAQQAEIDRFSKLKEMTSYERQNENVNLPDRAVNDMTAENVAIPGFQKFHLPGSNWNVKPFASPSQLLQGNFDWNPFTKRSNDQFIPLGGFKLQ